MPDRSSRRRVLGAAGAALLGGVVASRYRSRPDGPTTSGATSPPRPTTTTVATVPDQPATTTTQPPLELPTWQPPPGEVQVEAKSAAAAMAQLLTSHEAHDDVGAVVDRTLAGVSGHVDLGSVQRAAATLHLPGERVSGTVVYPQLGGLDPHRDPRSCSVMVVVDQVGSTTRVRRCLDLRLERPPGGPWEFTRAADVSGAPQPDPHGVSRIAAAVLAHPRIDLPDSARWDVHEGDIDDRVLEELLALADTVDVAVATICRGHPEHVFGTSRTSAHMAGRAIDVWSVGGPVVSQQHVGSAAHAAAVEVFRRGRIRNFGSPWSFDPPGGRSFTDPVHADHFHLGV